MKPAYLLLVYRDRAGKWRWRISHRNGKVIADGGEGYATRGSATRAGKRLKVIAAQAVIAAQSGA